MRGPEHLVKECVSCANYLLVNDKISSQQVTQTLGNQMTSAVNITLTKLCFRLVNPNSKSSICMPAAKAMQSSGPALHACDRH
mmetsp:Transcript_40131/g.73344  ORF Transcript_40131/g.73344 Transcript_40131/m.73344 type:complete len:83 (-) Transcript_40131:1602-1850(-)